MSLKTFSWILLGLIVLAALLVLDIATAESGTQQEFIQVSVLAGHQADYGVDEEAHTIPSISIDIITDKLRDEGKTPSSLPVILFTYANSSHQNGTDESELNAPENNIPDNPSNDQNTDPGNNGNANCNGNGNCDGLGNNGNGSNGNGNGNGNNGNGSGNNGNGNGNGNNGNGDNHGNGNGNSDGSGNGNGNGKGN